MKKLSLIVIAMVCLTVVTGVYSVMYLKDSETRATTVRLADDTNYTVESLSSLVDALNDFSFNFYQKISEDNNENVFFSPYSIFVALSMVYEGAGGNTAVQMQDILNILQNDSATRGSFGRLYNLLNQKQEGYTVSTANAFWAQQNYPFLPNYIDILRSYYIAEANELDFSKNDTAAQIINTWIEENTGGKIKDMIDSGDLSEFTRLVLTNAIYFKGLWENPFNPELTSETDFKTTSSETVNVDMMSISDVEFSYADTGDLQILKLPYKGNALSMIIVLPKENNISFAESALSAASLASWNDSFDEIEIDVKIPKFKFGTKYDLNNILTEMGMVDAFTGLADFSGMDGTTSLFISKVVHQAFVEVNEEGTEAAAATGAIATLKSSLGYFMADHPFVFLIQHEETGAILFMGKVMNPAQ